MHCPYWVLLVGLLLGLADYLMIDDVQGINFKLNISRALQLVHSVVLDTSAVFPHYCGLPYRRSLRSLVSSYLKVSIKQLLKFLKRNMSNLFNNTIL